MFINIKLTIVNYLARGEKTIFYLSVSKPFYSERATLW